MMGTIFTSLVSIVSSVFTFKGRQADVVIEGLRTISQSAESEAEKEKAMTEYLVNVINQEPRIMKYIRPFFGVYWLLLATLSTTGFITLAELTETELIYLSLGTGALGLWSAKRTYEKVQWAKAIPKIVSEFANKKIL